MLPRLKQPLFNINDYASSPENLRSYVRAYDCIWNLVYKPDDITRRDLYSNAKINLEVLGSIIEQAYGDVVFDESIRQLSFPDEIISP